MARCPLRLLTEPFLVSDSVTVHRGLSLHEIMTIRANCVKHFHQWPPPARHRKEFGSGLDEGRQQAKFGVRAVALSS